ncbi:hypothetical protein EDM68_04190 [Candidatus Uhrbacteria bacterium]|nr:MAG: hypothetical protein EDM68_04190 [Candidatus Uhrbacteria bacterium]
MDRKCPLSAVVFALHAPPTDMLRIFRRLGLEPDSVPTKELPWSHVRRSDEGVELVFGPAGLKRVCAARLVGQLTNAGFRYGECTLVVKRAIYTKTDERRSRRDPWAMFVREGQLKRDEYGKPAFKMYLEATFDRDTTRRLLPTAVLLDAWLATTVWKRGRILVGRREDENRAALVELVQLKKGVSRSVTELSFHPTYGFASYVADLP